MSANAFTVSCVHHSLLALEIIGDQRTGSMRLVHRNDAVSFFARLRPLLLLIDWRSTRSRVDVAQDGRVADDDDGDGDQVEAGDGGRIVRQFCPLLRKGVHGHALEEAGNIRMLHQVKHQPLQGGQKGRRHEVISRVAVQTHAGTSSIPEAQSMRSIIHHMQLLSVRLFICGLPNFQ